MHPIINRNNSARKNKKQQSINILKINDQYDGPLYRDRRGTMEYAARRLDTYEYMDKTGDTAIEAIMKNEDTTVTPACALLATGFGTRTGVVSSGYATTF
ncbi:hypothetical protein [Pandoraea sputorum]|uniref:hypothetical protein n=1 Tax=Pandoraea sputorum TaxID=93222 RepID=UPI001241FB44|nr:hypothetical protein [Pandoraea sputorum]